MMNDLSVFLESPFNDYGSISELFDNVAVLINLRANIEGISRNAVVV